MQTHGYLTIDNRKVLVLVRPTKWGVALKMRLSGSDGQHMTDEEAYLRENPVLARSLLQGATIRL